MFVCACACACMCVCAYVNKHVPLPVLSLMCNPATKPKVHKNFSLNG